MNEVQELKRHIRWLEDQAELNGGIGEAVDEIDAKIDRIIDVINNHADGLRAVVDALNQIIDAINKARPASPPPSPFNEMFSEAFGKPRPKPSPKHKSPKLKLVKKSDDKPPSNGGKGRP
jgi:hypothetical protein